MNPKLNRDLNTRYQYLEESLLMPLLGYESLKIGPLMYSKSQDSFPCQPKFPWFYLYTNLHTFFWDTTQCPCDSCTKIKYQEDPMGVWLTSNSFFLCSVLLSHLAIKWMDVRVSGNQFLFRLEGCCKCKHTKWNFWIPIQNNQALSLKVKYCDWAQLISGLVTIYLKDDSDFFSYSR